MRKALTLIEMILTMVIVGLVFTVVPKIIFVTNRSFETVVKEDALYNVREDPGETVDLVLQHPELAARLGRELEAWYDQALRSRLETGGEGAIPQEVLEQLQKMGYFGER